MQQLAGVRCSAVVDMRISCKLVHAGWQGRRVGLPRVWLVSRQRAQAGAHNSGHEWRQAAACTASAFLIGSVSSQHESSEPPPRACCGLHSRVRAVLVAALHQCHRHVLTGVCWSLMLTACVYIDSPIIRACNLPRLWVLLSACITTCSTASDICACGHSTCT